MAADEIAAQHGLSLASVYAALSYYFEHREAIEAAAAADEEFVESFRKQVGSRIRRPD